MEKVLFVIDAQKLFESKKTKEIARRINNYVKKNKNKYSFIVFTVFKNDHQSSLYKIFRYKKGMKKEEARLLPEITENIDASKVIHRNTYSLLKIPKIRNKLNKNNIKQVDLCGFDTDCCILATAFDLFEAGFKTVVLQDICFSISGKKLHDSALKIIKRNCGEIK